MDRWNELIAGFVLGNLTPEEAESIAKILAENPQLASHIARLRNTATVRSLSKAERLSARSQDGSEGWADTALDSSVPYHLSNGLDFNGLSIRKSRADNVRLETSLKDSLENRLEDGSADKLTDRLEDSLEQRFAQRDIPAYLYSRWQNSGFSADSGNTFNTAVSKAAMSADRIAVRREVREERRLSHLSLERFSRERFSLAEALLVPVFNPLWWTAIALAVAVSIDNFRVRRSLQDMQAELTELKAAPQIAPVEKVFPDQIYLDQIYPSRTTAPSQTAQ